MGFFNLGTDISAGTAKRRQNFTIKSGNGEESLSSYIEYDADPPYTGPVVYNSNPKLDLYYRLYSSYYSDNYRYMYSNDDPVVGSGPVDSWFATVTDYVGSWDSSSPGVESICLPLGPKSYVHVVTYRRSVAEDSAISERVSTYNYTVASLGGDLYTIYIGPTLTGTADPFPVVVETPITSTIGRLAHTKTFLVSYDSIKEIPVPAALQAILDESVPSEYPGEFPDYPGFTASSYGMNADLALQEVTLADGYYDAIGSPYSGNDFFTGGIYPVLQRDPEEWREVMIDPSTEDPYTLEGAADFLSSTFNPRAYLFPCINVGTCEPGKIGHDKASSPTATSYVPNRPEGTTLTTWRPENGSTAMHVWDGGNAGYCYGKLLELGFTAEDLTP